jgi:nucleoside-diphosphate kinase
VKELSMALERSFVLLKPDAVARRLVGEILGRFESKGLKIVAMKMLNVTPELSKQHYAEHVHKPFYPMLEEFITSGPVVALAVEGPQAISVIRSMLGSTNGREAPLGTIRGDFGLSRQMNLVHGSDGPDAAARELGIYFKPEELITYSASLDPWSYAGDEK